MKIKTTVATLSILSVLSFGAFAAEPISAEQAQNREAIGSVSVSAIGSSPMDMRQEIVAKAEKAGANSYRIIELKEGDNWHATAELYK